MRTLSAFVALLLIPVVTAVAQSEPPSTAATIYGTVVDDESGQPIRSSLIEVEGGETIRAADGTFELSLSPGEWQLNVTARGYLDSQVALSTESWEMPLEVRLRRYFLSDEVAVLAPADLSTRPSTVQVQPREVFDVAGSLDNVFRTLQLLPGVAAPEDFGGRLSVRGGGPDQNLTVMDGVEVHNPYRIFGLISAFNPETVDRFDLTAGGFGATHGDRLSSLLVIENRAGQPSFGGSAAISLTDANVVFEGGLPGDEANSWLVTARRTYYDLVASRVSDDDFPSFSDVQARLDLAIAPGILTLQGILSREGADFNIEDEEEGDRADAFADASNDLIAARYRLPLGTRGSSVTSLSWYRNSDFLDFGGTFRNEGRRSNVPGDASFDFSDVIFTREVRVEDLALRQDFSLAAGSSHGFEFGFELHDLESGTAFRTEGDRNDQAANGSSIQGGAGLPDEIDSSLSGTRGGIWVEDSIRWTDRLTVAPGVRFDWSDANGRSTLSPRLALLWSVSEKTRLKLAAGLFTQSPGYEKLQSADYFIDLSDARQKGILHQRADHAIVGLEQTFGGGFQLSLEAYYKRFHDLVIGKLETEEERLERISRYDFPDELQGSVPTAPIITSNPSNDGAGRAIGMDLYLVKRPTGPKGLYGWLAYTLGEATQDAYGNRSPLDYDRRHALSLVANYRFGRKWELAMTGRWATGFPYTGPLGVRVAATEDPTDDPDTGEEPRLIPATDADGNLIYSVDFGDSGDLNSGRLPEYARVDARVTFRPGGSAGKWEIFLEVLNLLDRENAGSLESSLIYNPAGPEPLIVETPDSALPRLPSFGVRFRF